jgi:hypothetical protein
VTHQDAPPDTAQNELIWSALRDHLERDPRGRELLASLRQDSTAGFARFDEWLRESHDTLPQPLQAKVSGGQVHDIWQIAEVHNLNVQPPTPPTEAEQRDRDNRSLMLNRVSHDWIDGWLVPSVEHGPTLSIALELAPDMLHDHWDGMVDRPVEPAAAPQPGSVLDAFNQFGHRLLLLGAPGAGKTTALLELLRALLVRADIELEDPMPVVFLLASWAIHRSHLGEWLSDELVKRYDVPRAVAQTWIQEGQILPLLDGLDDLPLEAREACVAAINAYQVGPGDRLRELVVTCRSDEYAELHTRLNVSAAIRLKPLTEETVLAQLTSAGPKLEGVRQALEHDPSLRELAASPLVLSLLIRTYGAAEAPPLPAPAAADDDGGSRLQQLFAAYADLMLRRTRVGVQYPREQSTRWLGWLAASLTQHSQSVLYVERLQPTWLNTRSGRLRYVVADRGCVSVLLGALEAILAGLVLDPVWALGYGAIVAIAVSMAGRTSEGERSVWRAISAFVLGGLLTCVLAAVVFAIFARGLGATILNAALVGVLIGAPVVGLSGGPRVAPRLIQLVERITWSLRLAIRSGATGLLVLTAVALILTLSAARLGATDPGLALLVAIVLGAPPAIVTAILGGFEAADLTDESKRTRPNQGIRRARRTALIAAGLSALGSAATVGVTFALLGDVNGTASTILTGPLVGVLNAVAQTPRVQLALVLGFLFASLYGLVGGLAYGGFTFLSHYALRWTLWRQDAMPLDYVRFLNYASDCGLLRKVGGGYRFVHGLLGNYFSRTYRDVPR